MPNILGLTTTKEKLSAISKARWRDPAFRARYLAKRGAWTPEKVLQLIQLRMDGHSYESCAHELEVGHGSIEAKCAELVINFNPQRISALIRTQLCLAARNRLLRVSSEGPKRNAKPQTEDQAAV